MEGLLGGGSTTLPSSYENNERAGISWIPSLETGCEPSGADNVETDRDKNTGGGMLSVRRGIADLCVIPATPSMSDISGGISASSSSLSPLSRWIFRLRQRHHDSAAMMIKSQMPIPTATPTIVWSLRTGSGMEEVRPSVPPAALAADAEAEALGRLVIVVVLRAIMLVTIDAPEPAAELKSVEIGVEAELKRVETGVGDCSPRNVDELPDDAVIDAPPDSILDGTLNTSVDDDRPTGG